jgi:hypothetical protein
VSRDIAELKKAQDEKDKVIEQLQEALEKIDTLIDLLPICSTCKKIRNDEGYWERVEEYISSHTRVQFSHSLCPTCLKKLYPEYSFFGEKRINRQNKPSHPRPQLFPL